MFSRWITAAAATVLASCAQSGDPAQINSLAPSQVSSLVSTSVIITGENLFASASTNLDKPEGMVDNTWQVFLDEIALDPADILLVDSQHLQIEVPPLPVDEYDVTVISPSGQTMLLPDALNVLDGRTLECLTDNECVGDGCRSSYRCDLGICIMGVVDKDSDLDGYIDRACGGDDCADRPGSDPLCGGQDGSLCNPGVVEGPVDAAVCNDGVDNDCNNAVDAEEAVCANLTFVSFQQGVGGYLGTIDTFFSEAQPNGVFGANQTMLWDLNAPAVEANALLQFSNIFGAGPSQIPPGAAIIEARLTVHLVTAGSGVPGSMHEVLIPWDETVDYLSFGGDPGYDATEVSGAIEAAPSSATACPCVPTTINVLSTVESWSVGGANHGWMFAPADTSVVEIGSSENASLVLRPKLDVTYRF